MTLVRLILAIGLLASPPASRCCSDCGDSAKSERAGCSCCKARSDAPKSCCDTKTPSPENQCKCVHGIPTIPSNEFPPLDTQTKSFSIETAAPVVICLADFGTDKQGSPPLTANEITPWGQFDSIQSMLCTWLN